MWVSHGFQPQWLGAWTPGRCPRGVEGAKLVTGYLVSCPLGGGDSLSQLLRVITCPGLA